MGDIRARDIEMPENNKSKCSLIGECVYIINLVGKTRITVGLLSAAAVRSRI